MPELEPQALLRRLECGSIVELSCCGTDYFIQQENNKGWDYLSIWRNGDRPVCLGRVFFDIFDGISEETVQELLELPCLEGRSLAELLATDE